MIPSDFLVPKALATRRLLSSGGPPGACTVGRPCLEQATELLTEWFGIGAAQANALISAWARRCGRSPNAVAQVLVHHVWQGDETYADAAVARTIEHALRNLPEIIAKPGTHSGGQRSRHDRECGAHQPASG